MANIKLGSISPYKVSVYTVGASTSTGLPVNYSYQSGRLPPGLRLEPDGQITGKVKNQTFSFDNLDTTFDNAHTTVDKDFNFVVRASAQSGQLIKDQTYTISCARRTKDEIGNMYGHLYVSETSRDAFLNFITNNKLFPTEGRYRDQDRNFNTFTYQFRVLFLAGVHLKTLGTILDFMVKNNYTVKLNPGDFKTAKAKDPAGNVIYEVVYAELHDAYTGSDNSITFANQYLPNITIGFSASTIELTTEDNTALPSTGTEEVKLYNNAIKHMQDELKSGLTVESFEYLPLWMKSAQDNGLVLGHKNVLPIRYCKEGEAERILYRIKNESNYDIKTLPIEFDRWIIDNNIGTSFDDTSNTVTATGDGSNVVFDSPNFVASNNALIVTVNGQRLKNTEFTSSPRADTLSILTDNSSLTADINTTGDSIVLNTAPLSGATVVIALKPTTFTGGAECTFDVGSTVTTFDVDGTRFHNLGVTFDRNTPKDTQLLMQRRSVTDRITHVSNQSELVRTR